jgi:hypothetical protein
MFAGMDFLLCGVLPAVRAAKLRDLIVANGGRAVVHKTVAAIFAPKTTIELPTTITHLIIPTETTTATTTSTTAAGATALCKKLNVPFIPATVQVLLLLLLLLQLLLLLLIQLLTTPTTTPPPIPMLT